MKPAHIFDREWEWRELSAFASDASPRATLGVVSGRRRQGKSTLLAALCQAVGGLYFGATEAAPAEALQQLHDALEGHVDGFVPALAGWDDAIRYLFSLSRDRSDVVVIDELPYLVAGSPTIPSLIQRELGPDRAAHSRVRLILCGSSMTFMGGLLGGTAPLRGRAGLQLVVRSFDYRNAREFWDIRDPRLAVLVHSVVGGTPAYGTELVRGDRPRSIDEFDRWICRTVLSPASPMFFEARYLLGQEAGVRDASLYHSILAAVAGGRATRGGIADYVGKPSGDLGHYLSVLEDAGLLHLERDELRPTKVLYAIAEPLITFYYRVMRPIWSQLELAPQAGPPTEVLWARSRPRFDGLLGAHFERLCRTWAQHLVDPAVFAGAETPASISVGPAVVNDAALKSTHQIDVLVREPVEGGRPRVLSIGEAKWGVRMGLPHLHRLQRIRALLAARTDVDAARARPACYSGAGFTDDLVQAGRRGEVLLVGLPELYGNAQPTPPGQGTLPTTAAETS